MVHDEIKNTLLIYCKGVNKDLSIWDDGVKELEFEKTDILESEVIHFYQCMEKRSTPVTDGKTGLKVIKVLLDAEEYLKPFDEDDIFIHESAVVDPPVKIEKSFRFILDKVVLIQ